MKTLRYKSRGPAVQHLEELLVKLGYNVKVTQYFGLDSHAAVKDFQEKHNLVVDGIVGKNTWKAIEKAISKISKVRKLDKLLTDADFKKFAKDVDLELAVVKAVAAVESSGKGFLTDRRPRILFEGHVMWRELKKRGIKPESVLTDKNANVLYKSWTRKFYLAGAKEYIRLEEAAAIQNNQACHDAAYCSASWGSFQIMGNNYESLGYSSIDEFVSCMYEHEREHLLAFGKFIKVNNLLKHLKTKDWAKFARGYNGPGYKKNKYDKKLASAYKKYNT
jgi:hypothetical protein